MRPPPRPLYERALVRELGDSLPIQGVFRFHVCPYDNAGGITVESTGINEPHRLEDEARIRAGGGTGSKQIVE